MLENPFVIETHADGILVTSQTDIDKGFVDLASHSRVVIHFHGGLVSAIDGRAIADRLTGEYACAGAASVFFVWHSGALEIIRGNLRQIFVEDIFSRMLRWLLKYAAGKIGPDSGGARGLGEPTLPTDYDVDVQLSKRAADFEPFVVASRRDVPDVTDDEAAEFTAAVEADDQLAVQLAALLHAGDPAARSIGPDTATPTPSLMSPQVVAELEAAQGDRQARSIVSTALLAKKCLDVLRNVVGRYQDGSDHGLYPTVVEELLREFYVANVGAAVWAAMKGDTLDTFDTRPPMRGGYYFLDKLQEQLAAGGPRPRITLVGHSTGAVFIDNFLDALALRQAAGRLPTDLRIDNVVFLAPACTAEHFGAVLGKHEDLIDNFRMFSMHDADEQRDHLIPGLYPRSLLYLVSGLLERNDHGDSQCVPLTGLTRYLDGPPGTNPSVARVRTFLAAGTNRVVLSPSAEDAEPGLCAGAKSHGDFDNDAQVLASLRVIIAGGTS